MLRLKTNLHAYFVTFSFIVLCLSFYRIPQVLVHYGVLKYSDELMDLLKSGKQ